MSPSSASISTPRSRPQASSLPSITRSTASVSCRFREIRSWPRPYLHWYFPGYLQASTRRGTWRTESVSVIRSGTWKLLHFYEDDRVEVYDLAADVAEKNDLAEERPTTRRALHQQLRQWLDAIDGPGPTPKEQQDSR